MSNKLTDIVNELQYKTGFTKEQLAVSVGYTRQHLSREMKKGNTDLELLLKEKHKEILQDVTFIKNATPLERNVANDAAIKFFIMEMAEIRSKLTGQAIAEILIRYETTIESIGKQLLGG